MRMVLSGHRVLLWGRRSLRVSTCACAQKTVMAQQQQRLYVSCPSDARARFLCLSLTG
eukprot:COSAG05_NODE_584_length_8527_cov_46.366279_4_plen_58_part_00